MNSGAEEEAENNMKCRHGLATKLGNLVPLKEISVEVTIQSFIAQVQSTLLYKNSEDVPVEATFTFPIDDGSAVFKFEADIEDRHIVAEVQEREQAKLTYQDAIDKGQTALLMKEDTTAGDIFQCMLGNLPAGCEATLTFTYVVELPQEPDGKLRFTLPAVLNPRYTPAEQGTVGAEGAMYVEPATIPYTFHLSGCVTGYNRVLGVTSELDKLDVKFEDNQHTAKVTLAEAFTFDHDLSLLVEYEDCYKPQVVLEIGDPDANGLLKEDLLMVNFRPDLQEVAMATSGEYIFVIDRSGSMMGKAIDDAREALLLLVKSLPPDCYFNIVGFGSDFKSLYSSGSKKYDDKHIQEAVKHIQGIKADMGGTELLKPLRSIFNKAPKAGHPRQIFLLTDGGVSNTDEVIGLVRRNSAYSRVYTLGIGAGVSTSLVKGVAQAGYGRAEFISEGKRIQPKVVSLLKCSMQPSISNVAIDWDLPPGITHTCIPEDPPALIVAGERLILFVLLHGIDYHTVYAASSVTLKGQHNSQDVSYSMSFRLADDTEVSKTLPLHRVAAKAQIKVLESRLAALSGSEYYRSPSDATIRNDMLLVSLHGNIVSKMASFVAIDKNNKKPVEGTMVERPCPIPTTTPEFSDGRRGKMRMYRANMSVMPQSYPSSDCGLGDEGLSLFESGYTVTSGDVMHKKQSEKSKRYNSSYDCVLGDEDEGLSLTESGYTLTSGDVMHKKQSEKSKSYSSLDCGLEDGGSLIAPRYAVTSGDVMRKKQSEKSKSSVGCSPSRSSIKNFFSRKKKKRSLSAPLDKAPVDRDDVVLDAAPMQKTADGVDDLPVTIVTNTETESFADTNMLPLITLQNLHGNWHCTQEVTSLLGISMETLTSCTVLKEQTMLITLAVVIWLRRRQSHRRSEWEMIETKAVMWLSKQNLEGKSLDSLFSEVENVLWPVD